MRVGILGATGSIGSQTLDIIRANKELFKVGLVSCGSNIELLDKINKEFKPEISLTKDDTDALSDPKTYNSLDIVVNGIGGIAGLIPSVAVLKSRAALCSANKESIVASGDLLMDIAADYNKKIFPLDSEHSAVWQLLEEDNISKIILTASGGPFVNKSFKELSLVTKTEALRHPTWQMGKKVTIDSATLMNKGMEVLEARALFQTDQIEVVIHKESLCHAIVEYKDGVSKLCVSKPDMKIPILYSLTYPKRISCKEAVDFSSIGSLKFERPDLERFDCLKLSFEILKTPRLGVVLQAADEVLVELFLEEKIGFNDIPRVLRMVVERYFMVDPKSIADVLSIDREVKEYTLREVNNMLRRSICSIGCQKGENKCS